MPRKVEEVITRLASRERVVMIGGLAVIAHGLSRSTKDAKEGLGNTLPEVREVIWREIEKLAADGDPFANELLEEGGAG